MGGKRSAPEAEHQAKLAAAAPPETVKPKSRSGK
jgi:hypothetical protein